MPAAGRPGQAEAISYLLAGAFVALAFGAELILSSIVGNVVRLGSFYPAVLASALLGVAPGVFALAASLFLAWYVLFPPSFSFALNNVEEVWELALFTISAALIIVVASAYRKAQAGRAAASQLFKAIQDISMEGVVIYRPLRDDAGAVADFEYRYANPAAIRFMSRSDPKRVVGGRLLERLPLARDNPHLFPRYLKVLETGETSEAEYELGGRWFCSNVAKLEDGLVVTVRDVSAQHYSDEIQKLLAQELHHRVKNMLATVISMTNFTARSSSSAGELKDKLLGRFQAMARAHELLVANSWTDALVGEVVCGTLEPHLQSNAHRFAITGPDVPVEPETALALNMALHELATNAIKYGALSAPDGQVIIEWRSDPERPSLVHLAWSEAGGPFVRKPSSKGFGTRLLEKAFAGQEGSGVRLNFAREGVRCEIIFMAKFARPAMSVGAPQASQMDPPALLPTPAELGLGSQGV